MHLCKKRMTLSLLFVSFWVAAQAHETLKVQFTNMDPHVGQKFELRIVDKATGKEVGRSSLDAIANHDFEVELEAIDIGGSYWIDFYADLNQNGVYDSPPTDHAWRLELNNAQGDTTLTFSHNTGFTDIGWDYLMTLNITGMNPHQGQLFELRVVDRGDGREIGRMRFFSLNFIDFTVQIPGLQLGRHYVIDFYADLNQNGRYDGPPADHAWRLEAPNVQGDVSLTFSHNTAFTDINWVNALTLQLANMNPHVGQKFEASVIDLYDMREVGRTSLTPIAVPNFSLEIPGIVPDRTYRIDFYADLNQNGQYDSPPADHAWREQFTSSGNTILNFTHNTAFADVQWANVVKLKLTNMNPHVGQKFEARVVDLATGSEIGRTSLSAITQPDFEVSIPGILPGHDYQLDFYADLNQNGLYDGPPADHAWREQFTSNGDVVVEFGHNTNFSNFEWPYLFTLNLSNMNPHLGQKFEMRLVDNDSDNEAGRISLQGIILPDFSVSIPGLRANGNYRVDYYADLNQNGGYDAPPADHAWRDVLAFVAGDTALSFVHNTSFTDIQWPVTTGVERDEAGQVPAAYTLSQNYPNPFNPETAIQFELPENAKVSLTVFNSLGQTVRTLLDQELARGSYRITWDGRNQAGQIQTSGIYFYRIQTDGFVSMRRMVLMR